MFKLSPINLSREYKRGGQKMHEDYDRIIGHLTLNPEGFTRQELVQITGLQINKVTARVNELIEDGFVMVKGRRISSTTGYAGEIIIIKKKQEVIEVDQVGINDEAVHILPINAAKLSVRDLPLSERVHLAKIKITETVLKNTPDEIYKDTKLRLAILVQSLEDLYLKDETHRAMATVYLYAKEISELAEINVETSWVQRILKELDILDVNDQWPYIEACLFIQDKLKNRHAGRSLEELECFAEITEQVAKHFEDDMCDVAAEVA